MPETDDLQIEATPGGTEIRIARHFDAPRARVFAAFTAPPLLKRWMRGPDGDWTLTRCDIDPRTGGGFHYGLKMPDGGEIGLQGDYHEVIAPERIVHTERLGETAAESDTLVSLVFQPAQGGTGMMMTIAYASNADRDRALTPQMRDIMTRSYARLDRLLAEMAAMER